VKMQRIAVSYLPGQPCSVPGCTAPAGVTVALVDRYPDGTVFCEQDETCPYLCHRHRAENEAGRVGPGAVPRSDNQYPFSNRSGAAGWSEYLPLGAATAGRRRTRSPPACARAITGSLRELANKKRTKE